MDTPTPKSTSERLIEEFRNRFSGSHSLNWYGTQVDNWLRTTLTGLEAEVRADERAKMEAALNSKRGRAA